MAMNRTRRCHGRRIAAALLVVSSLATPGLAETAPAYDKRIEDAAIRMLIPKLGDMRGSMGLKSNEYLRPLANERVVRSPQAAMIPTPVERPGLPENRRVLTSQQSTKAPPADKAAHATRAPQITKDRTARQADPAESRRSKGCFLFF
ncbi:hypothetical protein [uncultured Hoeflea sp.]|uniref:hypothetical protein n=1 Tax=uncultured Hoeflea sp. TaxID=538666 RepID=UPI0030DB6AA3